MGFSTCFSVKEGDIKQIRFLFIEIIKFIGKMVVPLGIVPLKSLPHIPF